MGEVFNEVNIFIEFINIGKLENDSIIILINIFVIFSIINNDENIDFIIIDFDIEVLER